VSQRTVFRYSLAFRQQVISELESGRFASIDAARIHYNIGGAETVVNWVRAMGKNHLLPKRVRVEPVDEADRIRELQKQVRHLEQMLGRTQADNLLNQSFLKLACDQLGVEVDAFRKKSAGAPSATPPDAG
jgi:transposase